MASPLPDSVEQRIFFFRGKRVMLDRDLAKIYGTVTKRLLEQVRRNKDRFPQDFAFQLNNQEFTILRSQIATSSWGGSLRRPPFVFTEHGAVMLASVLNTDVAIEASLRVVRAFVRLRELLSENVELARKFAELESRLNKHDEEISTLFEAIRKLLQAPETAEPRRQIGFHVKDLSNRRASKSVGI
jgi:hypothetical protein